MIYRYFNYYLCDMRKSKVLQYVIQVIGWGIVFGFPLFFTWKEADPLTWAKYLGYVCMPVFSMIIFYGNYFLLIDRVLFARGVIQFLLVNLVLFVVLSLLLDAWYGYYFVHIIGDKHHPGGPPKIMFILRNCLTMALTAALSVAIRMTENWHALENEKKELEKARAEAELQNLKSQLNPHFLFNTLNAGAQLAMMEEADRTGRFLENVAEFFRYNVRKNDEDAALREEIHLVDNYVYILNVRFAGEILFSKEVDESLLDVRVPSMILQPLVENAFNYGIRNIGWTGRIELSVYQREGRICISIWDNGAGMEKERIEQVLSGRAQEAEAGAGGSGVGMKNVMERLRLYFHDQAGLQIFSEGKNTGTEVLITIPAEQEEQPCIE